MLLFKNFLFTLIVPGSVAMWIPLWIVSRDARRVDWLLTSEWHMAGLVPAAIGLAGYFACLSDFMTIGRGTPAPIDPPTRLVVQGLYRFVRNPMYLSVGTLLVGEVIVSASLALAAYTALVWLAWHLVVVFLEEPALERTFGDEYRAYRASVPRWVPRWVPRFSRPT